MAKKTRTQLFEEASIPRALFSLALPTMLSQLISTIYNLADTLWVGQLNDPNQLAALSLVFPTQMLLTAFGNLFGIGAGTVISRELGAKNIAKAKSACIFGFYGSLLLSLLYTLFFVFFRPAALSLLGVPQSLSLFTNEYLQYVIVFGSIPSIFNATIANMLRGEGFSKEASIGLSFGCLLNILLDPFFVLPFGLGLEIKGAAIATLISTVATTLYFLVLLVLRRKKSVLSFAFHLKSAAKSVGKDVLLAGIPSALQNLLVAVSNMVLNSLMIAYGSASEAAIGITKKIDAIPMCSLLGLAQGTIPLLAYNYGAKNHARVKKSLRVSLFSCLGVSLIILILIEIFASPIVSLFTRDAKTVLLSARFLQLHCIALPFMAVTFLLLSYFQAIKENKCALALSTIRKGIFDIPLMLAFNLLSPMYGIIFTQPVTDFISATIALICYLSYRRKHKRELLSPPAM